LTFILVEFDNICQLDLMETGTLSFSLDQHQVSAAGFCSDFNGPPSWVKSMAFYTWYATGHPVGDRVMVRLVETLASSVRGCDHAGRYGGEEFMVMLPESTAETAAITADIRTLYRGPTNG
jgi:hypothetical protein